MSISPEQNRCRSNPPKLRSGRQAPATRSILVPIYEVTMTALRIATVLLLGTCQQLGAQERTYRSDAGDQFLMSCNNNGYVLTPAPQGEKIFMGKDCDVYSSQFGGGSWCVANFGFGVTVGPQQIVFTGQEPYCPGAGYSPFFCSCAE